MKLCAGKLSQKSEVGSQRDPRLKIKFLSKTLSPLALSPLALSPHLKRIDYKSSHKELHFPKQEFQVFEPAAIIITGPADNFVCLLNPERMCNFNLFLLTR